MFPTTIEQVEAEEKRQEKETDEITPSLPTAEEMLELIHQRRNMNQKSYDEIDWMNIESEFAQSALRALIPFAEMDRPGELEGKYGNSENLKIALQRGVGFAATTLTNQDFRNAAKVLFQITGTVPESYWGYEIEFKE